MSDEVERGTPIETLFLDLERIVGIDFDTLYKSLHEDKSDWAFVIKICAAIEAATTQLLTEILGQEEIRKNITRIPLVEGAWSKLELIKSLKLLSDDVITYIRHLAELRNSLAHDIRRINFSFDEHFKSLAIENSNKYKELSKSFVFSQTNLATIDSIEFRVLVRHGMYMRCLKLFAQVY